MDKPADAVSAFSHVKMEDAHKLFKKIQNWSVQTFGFVYHDTNGQNHGPVWKTQSFLLNEICTVILLQDYYGKGNLRKSYWNTVGEKVSNWECLFLHRDTGLFLSAYVDDMKLAGKKQNINPMWKIPNKEVDFENQHLFLIMFSWDVLKDCEMNKDIVDKYRTMFESRISAGATEKLPCSENLCISSWSYDMEGHAKNCVARYCELAKKTTQQLYKSINSMP